MRRNLIAGMLIVAGALLLGGGLSGLGLFGSHAAAAPTGIGDISVATRTGLGPKQPELLAGVQSSTLPTLPNSAAALLSIPRLNIHLAPVYDRGLDGKGAMLIANGYAVTHFLYSAPIGSGNAVLYGHDDIQGSIFGRLKDLRIGDVLEVTLPGTAPIAYQVTARKIVSPAAVQILNPTADVRLTLFTCYPNWIDNQRVVITATPS